MYLCYFVDLNCMFNLLLTLSGSLFVMGAGLTAEWEAQYSGIADPALSAVAAIVLVIFNFPFSTVWL